VKIKECNDGGVVFLEITLQKGAAFAQQSELIAKTLVSQGAGIREMKPVRSSLEDVFSRLTQAREAVVEKAEVLS
jgi:hypothetical protein